MRRVARAWRSESQDRKRSPACRKLFCLSMTVRSSWHEPPSLASALTSGERAIGAASAYSLRHSAHTF